MGFRLYLIDDREWIRLAIKSDFRALRLACLCKTSMRQLERFFGNRFRQTPKNWLRATRVRTAAEMIQRDIPIKCVVVELRYTDASHFVREFKKYFCCTPTEYTRTAINRVRKQDPAEF